MYKVFINDTPIILSDSSKGLNNYEVVNFEEINSVDCCESYLSGKGKPLLLFCSDLERDWQTFLKSFLVLEAAGGKVCNTKGEVLFIHRFGKWDLPKGHIEKGESKEVAAIREVEEECGIRGLQIKEALETTYHIFKFKNSLRMKVTYWFLMETSFSGELIPQEEEGITDVVFKNKTEVGEALKNTYENIRLLF